MRPTDSDDENARALSKTGARLGAAAGNRVGPVTTGLTSGFGGAVGYLTGAAIDSVETKLDEKKPIPDGGSVDDDAESIEIPVEPED